MEVSALVCLTPWIRETCETPVCMPDMLRPLLLCFFIPDYRRRMPKPDEIV